MPYNPQEVVRTLRAQEVVRTLRVGAWKVRYRWRSRHSLFGRFGAGWQWALGFRLGRGTLLVDCLIFSIMISKATP